MKWKNISRFGMKLALGQIKGPKKLIALDIGSLSTGIAVSCPNLQKSYLLKVIKCPSNSPVFIKKLRHIVSSQQNLYGIVVGKPIYQLNVNKINEAIDKIAKIMQTQNNSTQQPQSEIIYTFQDENWTTKQAKQKIKQFKQAIRYHGHLHNEKQLQDGIAAMKILDRYLQYYNQNKIG